MNGSQVLGVGMVGRQCTDSASARWCEGRFPEFILKPCRLPSLWPDQRFATGKLVAVEGEVAVDLRMVDRERGRDDAGLEVVDRVRRQPRLKLYVRLRWILLVILGPFVILGLLVVVIKAFGLIRYDPAYFRTDYVDRYSASGEVARALENWYQLAASVHHSTVQASIKRLTFFAYGTIKVIKRKTYGFHDEIYISLKVKKSSLGKFK